MDRQPEPSQRLDVGEVARVTGQVELVDDEQRRDPREAGAGDIAIDDERITDRKRRHHDAELVEIGGDRFLEPAAVAAAEHVASWQSLADRPVVRSLVLLDQHLVAGHDVELASADLAGQRRPRIVHDQHAAAVALDDAAADGAVAHCAVAARSGVRRSSASRAMRTAGGGCES